jgi:hypothetical protein
MRNSMPVAALAAALVVLASCNVHACGSLEDVMGRGAASKAPQSASPSIRRLVVTWNHSQPARAFVVSRIAKGDAEGSPLVRLEVVKPGSEDAGDSGDAARLERKGNTWTHVLTDKLSSVLKAGDCLEVSAEALSDGTPSLASERACVEEPGGATPEHSNH